jgi:hypothetical protein
VPEAADLANPEPEPIGTIVVANRGVNIIEHEREFHMYRVTATELDRFAEGFGSVHLALFGIAAGGFIGVLIGLLTGYSTMDPKVVAIFVGLLSATLLGSMYFGVQARRDRNRALKDVRDIKQARRIS